MVPWSAGEEGECWDIDVEEEGDWTYMVKGEMKEGGADEGLRMEIPWFNGSEECVEKSMPTHLEYPFLVTLKSSNWIF